MALPPPPAGSVRMEYEATGGEAYAPISVFRDTWWPKGWRSPLDDPDFDGNPATPEPPSMSTHEDTILDRGLHGVVECNWPQDGTAGLTRTVMTQDGSNLITAAVTNRLLTFTATAAGGNHREAWRIDGTSGWEDSEMRSMLGRSDTLGADPNLAQWGHIHRLYFDEDLDAWLGYAVWTDVLFATPTILNLGVVSFEGTDLDLNLESFNDIANMYRALPVHRAQRTSNVVTCSTTAPWLSGFAVGDVGTLAGMAVSAFNAASVALTAVDKTRRTFSFAQTAGNATDADAGGVWTPAAPKDTLPFMLATRVVGNTIWAKQWRPEEPEPDWSDTSKVFVSTVGEPGVDEPAPFAGTGECALWVGHMNSPNKLRYGGLTARKL